MASPISFGDAYLLGNLAFKLGRAFTKGRKSAPAEFREVENQLYSLSAALQAFKTASNDGSISVRVDSSGQPQGRAKEGEDDDVLAHVLRSCEQTLNHLETIVQKYGSIGRPREQGPEQARFKRWNDNVKHAWKSIWWTTEGGDLATLRSNLTVHTNSLNLLLGVIVNSQTGRIEARVNDIDSMLREIHVWFTENLKDSSLSLQNQNLKKREGKASELDFELHADGETESRLVCPHAVLNPDFLAHRESTSHHELFACRCSTSSDGQRSHRAEVAAFALSRFSICTRLAGNERILMLYKAIDRMTSALKSLYIKRVPRSEMAYIEEMLLDRLTISQAKQMILQGPGTVLCFAASGPAGSQQAHILNVIADTRSLKGSINSVTFKSTASGGRSYEREPVESVQILHYRDTDLDSLMESEDTMGTSFQFDERAEIVLYYAATLETTDIVQTRLHLTPDTKWHLDTSCKALVFEQVDCTGYTASDEAHPTTDIEVTICFKDIANLSNFKSKVKDMQLDLFVMSLKFPRALERRLWTIQAYDVHTETLHIEDAEISILQNTETQRCRLTIISRDSYSIVSQELAEDFFESLSLGTGPKFNSLTYVVQFDSSGNRNVSSIPTGIAVLGFSDITVERLFHLSLTSVESTTQPLIDSNVAGE
ncbi:hypothetical protein FQN49_000472 [Arthroderma sp. PD_2]|nr:hypothetical protein FQN49_000472 [Arthroderma sp. PD_2]